MRINVVYECEIPEDISEEELNNHIEAAQMVLEGEHVSVRASKIVEDPNTLYRVTGFTRWGDTKFTDWDKYKGGDLNQFMDSCENALVDYMRENKIKFDPDYHQHGDYGCPIINNTYRIEYSLRGWSKVLARVYGGTYVDYYCSKIDEPTLPPKEMYV